jgi:hypothetical protein
MVRGGPLVSIDHNVNISFSSEKNKNKFIKEFQVFKGKSKMIDGHITTETVEIEHSYYKDFSRKVLFSVNLPFDEMDKVLGTGEWTVKLGIVKGEGNDINQYYTKNYTHKVIDPTWGKLWDAAEVLFRACHDHHCYFEGINIDHTNRVIELSMGS